MPRPIVPRRVCCELGGRGFRPIGRNACKAEAVSIRLDELEAIRLTDLEGLYQDAASVHMGVSRQTYARILSSARHAVAACLVEGRMLVVEAGPVIEQAAPPAGCPVHGGPRRRGRTCHCSPEDSGCEVGCSEPSCACRSPLESRSKYRP